MGTKDSMFLTTRRRFLQYLAMLGIGGRTLFGTRRSSAALEQPADWPAIPRRKLGRTGFEASRLVFGCGAALSRGRNDALLDAAFEAGINVFDVGSRSFYNDAERNLAPFLQKHRDEVFLISKAMVGLDIEPSDVVTVAQAKTAAATWSARLDQSLTELHVEKVDAYYLMATNNPSLVGSEEVHAAFQKAKQAGKVDHLGISTHQNAGNVLEKAAATGWYSLAMIAITPSGWYDWASRSILDDGKTLTDLEPFLARVRAAGISLVGMKAGRYLAGRKYLGWKNPDAFDKHYDEKVLASGLSAFQRSYAYVLAHGVDVVNADMQSMPHLRENVIAAASSARYFA
jgi:aryl-alcohol dehydrogenase-like predicted oxidoreductase